MMQINFYALTLQCRQSREVIDLSNQVVFFHGKVSSGKSSIARLIVFCLGGHIERTIAIQKELISVSLELAIGRYKVLLERNTDSSENVTATCIDGDSQSFTLNVPIIAGTSPIWGDKVYNLSDLIFYLLDINVLRIPSNKSKDNATLVRLSFRNFMWYCYLDQSKFDSSFFRHEDATKARNSKEILKYIFQYSTQKLLELQEELNKARKERAGKQMTVEGLRSFLKKIAFTSEEEILLIEETTKEKLETAKKTKRELEGGYSSSTHFVDTLRIQIKELIEELNVREHGILDLENRLEQQESLRAELVASKFKIARSEAIANVFGGVEFKHCPECGTSLYDRVVAEDTCKLCLSPVGLEKPELVEQAEVIQIDLYERIKELENSIDLHKKALNKTRKEFTAKQQLRRELDQKLQHDLRQYESVFLSNIRAVDSTVASLQERLKSIRRLKVMPREIARMEGEAESLVLKERDLRRKIGDESSNFVKGESLIQELEETFLDILCEVGMPGVSKQDSVSINRKTWDVSILPHGEDYLRWNFYNAGSGGKKTLFNSCFLLAVHVIASKHNLPLPTFIVIDTPMKNIDKEVNQDIFRSFYDYLYKLASTILEKTQIVIIDNNFVPPNPEIQLSFNHRYMASGDPDNPPLIPYYVGP